MFGGGQGLFHSSGGLVEARLGRQHTQGILARLQNAQAVQRGLIAFQRDRELRARRLDILGAFAVQQFVIGLLRGIEFLLGGVIGVLRGVGQVSGAGQVLGGVDADAVAGRGGRHRDRQRRRADAPAGHLRARMHIQRGKEGHARVHQTRLGLDEIGVVQILDHRLQVLLGGFDLPVSAQHTLLGGGDLLLAGEVPQRLVEVIRRAHGPIGQARLGAGGARGGQGDVVLGLGHLVTGLGRLGCRVGGGQRGSGSGPLRGQQARVQAQQGFALGHGLAFIHQDFDHLARHLGGQVDLGGFDET